MLVTIDNVSPKIDLLSVTFDPATAEIRRLIVTHSIGGHFVVTIIDATCLVRYIKGNENYYNYSKVQ